MKISFLTKEDLNKNMDKFCNLSRACFTAKINKEIVFHRYLENPYKDFFMCVVECNEKFVANYAVLPVKICIGGEIVKAGLSVNLMTDPYFAGRGLFSELANRVYERMIQEGYALSYVFPNKNSNSILCNKLGWKNVYEIPTLEKKLDENIISVERVGKKLDIDNWSHLSDYADKDIHVIKEPCYLNWRYRNHPANEYHILHFNERCWAVYHMYNDEVNINEIHSTGNKEEFQSLLNEIIYIAYGMGAKKITTWFKTNTIEHYVLEKNGFINTSPIRYFSVKNLAYSGAVDIFDWRNWKICMGDDNVY